MGIRNNKESKFHRNLKCLSIDNLISDLKETGKKTYCFNLVNQSSISEVDSTRIDFSKFQIQVTDMGVIHPSFNMISPVLNKDCPHIYQETEHLCPFHPKDIVWKKNRKIKRMILLLYSWVFNYCIWEKTGIWYGKEYKH